MENGRNGNKLEDFSSEKLKNTKSLLQRSRRLKRFLFVFIFVLGALTLFVGVCAALNLRSPGDRDVKSGDIPDVRPISFRKPLQFVS